MNIYFDESGFTGYNLLDPDQPIFAIASTIIMPDEAEHLLKISFPNYRGKEFKFSNIVNSRNQIGLRRLGDELFNSINRIFIYDMDKKFAVFSKMVDFLIEPAITGAGYDFYANGFNRKYANYIYFGLTHIARVNIYDELVIAYMAFSRTPSADSLHSLRIRLVELEREADLEVKTFLAEMIVGIEILTEHFDLGFFRRTNETQLTTMLATVGRWRQRYPDDFHIIHDNSSNFLRQREMWEAITNMNVPRQMHSLGDGTIVEFPLRVIDTVGEDSANNYSIQLCDILAGFSTQFFRHTLSGIRTHPIQLIAAETGLGQLDHSGIMFSGEFPEFPPARANGPDVIDQMTRIITGD